MAIFEPIVNGNGMNNGIKHPDGKSDSAITLKYDDESTFER